MHKYEYNDYELLYLINRKSDIAYEILFQKYKLLVLKKIMKYHFDDMTKEDLLQECLLEMHKSFIKFNEKLNVLFITYIDTIFQRKINRVIMKMYKEYKTADYLIVNANRNLSECSVSYNNCLEDMVAKEKINLLLESSSVLEKSVIKMIMFEKMSINDFSQKYNVDKKKIYNVIQQIRKKCSAIIKFNSIDN